MSDQETLITSLQGTCFQNAAGQNCPHGNQTFTKWTERNNGPGLSGFSQGGAVDCLSVTSKTWRPGLLVSPFLSHFLLFRGKEPAIWALKALPGLKLKNSNTSCGVLLPQLLGPLHPVPSTFPAPL